MRWGKDNKASVCEKNPNAGSIGPQRGFLQPGQPRARQGVWVAASQAAPFPTKRNKVPRLPTWIQATRGPAAPPRPRPAVSLTTVTSRPGRGKESLYQLLRDGRVTSVH